MTLKQKIKQFNDLYYLGAGKYLFAWFVFVLLVAFVFWDKQGLEYSLTSGAGTRDAINQMFDTYPDQMKAVAPKNRKCPRSEPNCDLTELNYDLSWFEFQKAKNHVTYNVKRDYFRYFKDLANAPARTLNTLSNSFKSEQHRVNPNKGFVDLQKDAPMTMPFYISRAADAEIMYLQTKRK